MLARGTIALIVVVLSALTAPGAATSAAVPSSIIGTSEVALDCADPMVSNAHRASGNSVQSACVAGMERRVRGRIGDCPTDGRATVLGSAYAVGDCRGRVNKEIEAVAQARFVARENKRRHPTATAISPDFLWEVRLSGSDKRRIDVLVYDSEQPDESTYHSGSPINLVELKLGSPGSVDEDDAVEQVRDYRDDFGNPLGHQVRLMPLSAEPYEDEFTYQSGCGEPVRYVARSTQDGVVMVFPEPLPSGSGGGGAGGGRLASEGTGQQILDGEAPLECPVLSVLDPDEEWETPAVPEGDGPTCGLDPEEVGQWFDDVREYMVGVPGVAMGFAKRPLRYALAMADKMLEQKKVADRAPTSTCGRPGAWGDPHLTTLDGLSYDIQSVGEFTLVDAPDAGLRVQGRFTPWRNSGQVSVLERIAFDLNGFTVEMDSANQLWVDGALTQVPADHLWYFNAGSFLTRDESGAFWVFFPQVDGQTGVSDGLCRGSVLRKDHDDRHDVRCDG